MTIWSPLNANWNSIARRAPRQHEMVEKSAHDLRARAHTYRFEMSIMAIRCIVTRVTASSEKEEHETARPVATVCR